MLEGDVQGSADADRLAALHIPVVQLNTDSGFGGECHLDANMVRSALPDLPLDELDLLVIENVGNLVCPAEFRVGEDARIMVSSVTEGEDKPLKYPLMFRACELVLINKIDLLEHLDFDLELFHYKLDAVHPEVETMRAQREDRRGDRRLPRLAGAGRRRGAGPRLGRDESGTGQRSPSRLDELLAARSVANREFFAAEADALARLCHRMAERFARGGRLVAVGVSPAARSDVRHVTVEFVHPVIVGKRALPAIGLSREGGPLTGQLELIGEPDDIVIALRGARAEGEEVRRGARARPRARLPDDRLRARRRRRVGASCRRATTRSSARSWSRPPTTCSGSWSTSSSSTAACSPGARPGRSTTAAPRASSIPFLAEARDRPRRGARRRPRPRSC